MAPLRPQLDPKICGARAKGRPSVRTVNSNRALLTRTAGALLLLAGCLLTTKQAAAEVTLVKSDTWEVYTSGRVNVFYGYAFGGARPPGPGTLKGGGVGFYPRSRFVHVDVGRVRYW